ncbi:hypothetical protein DICVIV_14305 [Dictyocaulus viviparus]|uniref:Uncharacterized protein n=1 Tax=Dictyocaulus viviparus TaxID=29172 RepID=A0A0D8X828_DICVI|nr:hypothetical protein DICVIV_14305 [Dictyocaulus viviparus]
MTKVITFYSVLDSLLIQASDVTRSVVYILLMIIWIMTVVETLYIFHKDRKKEIKEENDNKKKRHRNLRDSAVILIVKLYL